MVQYVNSIDEQGFFMHMKAYDNGKTNQINSHGYSYLGARKILAKGEPIGLELLMQEKEEAMFNKLLDKRSNH